MPAPRRPTDAELAILRVLWALGAGTVREVAVELRRESAYTTVLKLLQIMTDKGLVRRDESARTHVYRAARSERATQRQLVRDLADRAFGGSAARLALQALALRKASPEELAEVRGWLAERDGKREGAR